MRFRKTLLQDSSRFILRMQKSLELMNVKLHTVISDITGQTGTAIIEAIIAGERKAENFLPLVGQPIKASHQIIIQSLQRNWREEHLFTLKESYEFYKIYRLHIEECVKKIEIQLQQYAARQNEGILPAVNKKQRI
jgi:transposase